VLWPRGAGLPAAQPVRLAGAVERHAGLFRRSPPVRRCQPVAFFTLEGVPSRGRRRPRPAARNA
jgi:hypothetical protein